MDLNATSIEFAMPVAIVGIGCRFPGGVNSAKLFWNLLTNKIDAIGEIPPDRMDVDALYDPRPAVPGKIMTRWGGFLESIDTFDAEFFGISPREAERLDPQQRLLLEVAWSALEDAGEVPSADKMLHGGVFVGCWLNDYEGRLFGNPDEIDFYMTTGSGRYSASGRLSYFLGMQGPSMTIDTACSSSLVAVHLACQSLRNRECSIALAGGANVILQPHISIAYSQSKMMAPDGRCKFGDERGNGYVRSEGAALVALKRLDDAIADNNPIYAVILGSAVNNDGRSSGTLTTPGGAGQEDMLRKAYRSACVSPGQVQYVEAHGTGTRAGDPVEIKALGAVLQEGRPEGSICRVGSVKTNLGHTEGAAGIAGLIKVALSLKHKYLPASLHFQNPNPNIPWDELPIRVQSEGSPWPEHSGPAIAGVSAFGIAGTNAHVVLQEAPALPKHEETAAADNLSLLPVSAHSPAALRDMVVNFLHLLEGDQPPALRDLGYTASQRRTHHDYRAAFVASSTAALKEQLAAYVDEWQPENVPQVEDEPRKILFVFPGQGSQWVGMGRNLLETAPVFRQMLERCDATIQPLTGWSLIERLCAPDAASYLEQIDFIQPALFAMQVALAEQWRAWGIEPTGVIGHSMGEVAAAYFAGVLRLEDAARVICRRSQLMKTVSGKGAMYSVDLSYEDARSAISGYEDRISIAVSNSPRASVLSGDPAALEEVVAALKGREVLCRQVKVDVAAHSPIMDTLRPALEQSLAGLKASASTLPIYSTVTAQLQPGEVFDIAYWGRNLRQPVLFSATLQQALADGFDTVIEISPHPVLLAATEQCFKIFYHEIDRRFLTLPSSRRNEDEQVVLLQSLGALYTLGHPVDWTRLYPTGELTALPTYPWQREHYWLETKRSEGSPRTARAGAHPLSGQPVEVAGAASTFVREVRLSKEIYPEVFAHRLFGTTLLPASAYIELVWAAAEELLGQGPLELQDVYLERALLLADDQPATVQVVLTPAENESHTFHIHSRAAAGWQRHASGRVRRMTEGEGRVDGAATAPRESAQALAAQPFYRWLSERGIQFDAPLHAFEQVWRGNGFALGEVAPAGTARLLRLDPLFQLTAAALPDASEVHLPTVIDLLRLNSPADGGAAAAKTDFTDGQPVQQIWLTGNDGQPVMEMRGVRLQALGRTGLQDVRQWLYDLEWQPTPRKSTNTPRQQISWLILADKSGMGQAVAQSLEQQGDACTLVFAESEQEIEDWLNQPSAAERGILYLWSLDHGFQPKTGLEALEKAIAANCLGAQRVTKLAAASSGGRAPRLWLITQGAQTSSRPALDQAPLWGLGRVIAEEHPDLWGGLIDLDPALTPEKAAELLAVEVRDPQETQLAFSGQQRQALRLVRHAATEGQPPGKVHWRPDASYLITGGLGGIGTAVARWMVQQGARRLILMGRTPLPPRKAWHQAAPDSPTGQRIAVIRALEAMGASVHVAAVDSGDEVQLRAWLEDYQQEGWPAIRGVVHAAGVTRDQLVTQVDPESWQTVMRPKLRGGWLLHSLLGELDFFITFSSIGSILGPNGQGSYASANAFLDALAAYRRSQGLPALSINWGVWAGVGMSAGSGGKATLQALESQGMAAIRPEQALAAMALLISQQGDAAGAAQTVVLPADWERVQASHLSVNRRNFFSAQFASKQPQSQEPARASLRETLAALEPGKRRQELESYLQGQIAQVLKLPAARIAPSKPLGSFGLDSLMGIELRGRLEAALDISLSATFVWNYPTLVQMTTYIAERMGISLTESAAPPVHTIPVADQTTAVQPETSEEISPEISIDDLLAQLESQSDESVQQALQNNRPDETTHE